MPRGNEILLSAQPQGKHLEGIIYGTPKPGVVMQPKAGAALVGGRETWEVYNRTADGDRGIIAVLLPDHFQGKTATDAYVSGTRGFLYVPVAGEEFNLIKLDITGTGDDLAIGDYMIVDDGTGKIVKTTGSPQAEAFICLETVTDPTADQLVHVRYTGY